MKRRSACASSSPASPATSAARSCRGSRADGPRAARPGPRPVARAATTSECVRGDVRDRRRAGRGARGRRRRLLPHPLDGDRRATARSPRARSRARRATSPRRPRAAGRRADRLPRRASCPQARRSRRTWPAAWRVEELLLEAVPDSVALRASIVIGARSRSFRFLVRLVERDAGHPAAAVVARPHAADRRARRARVPRPRPPTSRRPAGGSLDIAGPDVLTYGEMIERIRDLMLVGRPRPAPAGHHDRRRQPRRRRDRRRGPGAHRPLMGSLGQRHPAARRRRRRSCFGVRLHRFDRAVERALREWEELEPGSVAAR